jgi:hypothetical protein
MPYKFLEEDFFAKANELKNRFTIGNENSLFVEG